MAEVVTAESVAALLARYRFDTSSESLLQEGIAQVLEMRVPFEREVRLAAGDRIDFMVGAVGVECKIDGSTSSVLRQLSRYAEHERVAELLLVTSRRRHREIAALLPSESGRPVVARVPLTIHVTAGAL